MKYGPDASLADFIMVIDDGLTPEWSARLLDTYQSSSLWSPATVESGRAADNVRNCDLLDLNHPDTMAEDPDREPLIDDLTAVIGSWARAYEAAYVPIGMSERTGLGLARYGEGGFYRSHHDHHLAEVRTLTMIAIVDTEFTGGELSFFRGGHVLDLRPGQVCLFPATFQYPHSVEPVQSGVRHSLIGWLR